GDGGLVGTRTGTGDGGGRSTGGDRDQRGTGLEGVRRGRAVLGRRRGTRGSLDRRDRSVGLRGGLLRSRLLLRLGRDRRRLRGRNLVDLGGGLGGLRCGRRHGHRGRLRRGDRHGRGRADHVG